MNENNQGIIKLYPSYWIYNAGIVGIARTLDRYGMQPDIEFKIDEGSLELSKKAWEKLPTIYTDFMAETFNTGRSVWFNYFFSQKGNRIFQNNIDPNQLSGYTIEYMLTKEELTLEEKVFLLLLSMESTGNASTDIKSLKDKNSTETLKSELTFMINALNIDKTKMMKEIKQRAANNRKDKNIKKFNYKSFQMISRDAPLYHQFRKHLSSINSDIIYNCTYEDFDPAKLSNDAGNRYIFNEIKKRTESVEGPFTCAFCGHNPASQSFFDMRWFSLEGGSIKGFKNFYWGDSSQLPICSHCQMVLYFSPLGIFPDSDTRHGEFINIPNVMYLWELNRYRMDIHRTGKQVRWAKYDERGKLIDSIVSTGAILQLKSRWLLQNIELIELGGQRKDSVYNLQISPAAIKIIYDYSSESIVQWLNQIEAIQVRKPGDKIFPNRYIYSNKYAAFTNGREIIDKFLENKTGWITKTAVLLFKLFFEERNKQRLNLFSRLIDRSLKPLLLINLSLLKGKESHSEFFQLGIEIARMMKNKEDFETKYLPILFNCVYTLRKNDFVETLIRLYMGKYKEVDYRLLDIFGFDNIRFQTESLLLLIGILQRFYKGEKND